MDFSSFLTSLATSFIIFVVLMLLFTWLSRKPGNKVIYYPNRILKGLDPWEGGSRTRNPFAWIKEALTSSEQDVISMSGVDTAVYFVYLGTDLLLGFKFALLGVIGKNIFAVAMVNLYFTISFYFPQKMIFDSYMLCPDMVKVHST
ncbi:CSC1/OSCA1-like, N-terminal transmembrane domain [Dillenia turbinata]|uniref:CSC1/OSCA1-like, N-terminal transmembrane domain n=1 Tax=Dillenia turbinata TaxID=194707 RepID=A0AAN8VEP3_9MAGN